MHRKGSRLCSENYFQRRTSFLYQKQTIISNSVRGDRKAEQLDQNQYHEPEKPNRCAKNSYGSSWITKGRSVRNFLEPPRFISSETNKGRFATDINRWINMLAVHAEDDKKVKVILMKAGCAIYWGCDEQESDRTEKAERNGFIRLEGGNQLELNKDVFLRNVISLIWNESANRRVAWQVELLTDIQN